MLNLILGFVLGVQVTVVALIILFIPSFGWNESIAMNAMIAGVALVGVLIHIHTLKRQHKDKVWSLFKDELLILSDRLEQSIAYAKWWDENHDPDGDDQPIQNQMPQPSIEKDLHTSLYRQISYLINSYDGLLNKELMLSLKDCESEYRNYIFLNGVCDTDSTHMNEFYQKLKDILNAYIVDLSGINE